MSTTPTVQQAWIAVARGHPKDALKLKKDWPVSSKLNKGEVLVKIEAAALNPAGYKLLKLVPNFLAHRPTMVEADFAGVIEDPGDSSFAKGEAVFGGTNFSTSNPTKQGALGQYVRLPADQIASRPSNVSAIEAAGINIVAQTAWEALLVHGKLEEGQTVFINGGGSEVGRLAVQIAKAKGAKVVVSASGAKESSLRELGVDGFFDYTKEPLHQQILKNLPEPKYHLIFDAAGLGTPDLYNHSPKYLAPGGSYISVGPNIASFGGFLRFLPVFTQPTWLGGVRRPFKIFMVQPNQKEAP
ncbi:NAD(P)-binding protein [Cylindrobasidium torrendii FP15055 ss-10]|uniref:NAD(P)-binding protein n=1 Tax=Cylindrobasidium torrendii FP15055 ss-10 TaxID=1314674 RepID=A0A0D7BT11_9AGAR|nr:NAD(P)-binding protein [Cylindrobasidium torrendii FP15055 ss-10]